MEKNLRRERFEKVAARRVQRILQDIETLKNCSNKRNYDYSEDDVKRMMKVIKERIKSLEASFFENVKEQDDFSFYF
jgi:hypothetical protein